MAAISEMNEDDEEGDSDSNQDPSKAEESKANQVVDKDTENNRKIVSSLHNNMQ